jgi:hypothetical protein
MTSTAVATAIALTLLHWCHYYRYYCHCYCYCRRPGGRRRIPSRTSASKKSVKKAPPKPEPYVAADFDFDLLNDEDADIYDAGTVLLSKH